MRILHVVTAFPRFPNDIIAPWLVELLKRFQAAGHEVEVFAPAYRGGGNREVHGLPLHRFRYFPARWEDLTHDQGTPDRVRRSLRYEIMPLFYAVRYGGCAGDGRMTSSTFIGPCRTRCSDGPRGGRAARRWSRCGMAWSCAG